MTTKILKTYVYTGKDETRVKLKKGQAKVTIQRNESFQTDINYKNAKYMTLVGAESIDEITGKVESAKVHKGTVSALEAQEKRLAEEAYLSQVKKIEESYAQQQETINKEIEFLKVQKEAAKAGIKEEMLRLQQQMKELGDRHDMYADMEKDIKTKFKDTPAVIKATDTKTVKARKFGKK